MTGTLDDSPIGDTVARDRRLPFDHIRGPDTYLITFTGGEKLPLAVGATEDCRRQWG